MGPVISTTLLIKLHFFKNHSTLAGLAQELYLSVNVHEELPLLVAMRNVEGSRKCRNIGADEVASDIADLSKTAKLAITHEKERLLIMQIVRFPEALSDAIADLVPNRITDYLYELTDIFNSFYVECPVRSCPTPNIVPRA